MNSILFGFKGCGKTYLGKLLAQRLGRSFIDTDDVMLTLYGQEFPGKISIKELYQRIGEQEFRNLEIRAISQLIGVKNSIIALGGGTILQPRNLDLLQTMGTLIYLQVSLSTLKKRGTQLLVGPLDKLYEERIPWYESIASHRVNVDSLDEKEILASLCAIATQGASSYGL